LFNCIASTELTNRDDTKGDSIKLFRGYKDGPQLLLATQSVERQIELSSDLTRAQIYPVHGGPTLTHEDELKKDLYHYYFDAWPDHGVPEGIAVQRLKALVLEVGRKREELGDCEVWVHWYVPV
jgi:protein tyrosine phosphatase